jgi:glycosyltransferase involved in cell wall biosynthesis
VRIVLASEVFPPRAGGVGWSTRALGLALREAGHAVEVLSTSPGPQHESGLPVRRLTAPGRKRLAVPRAFARTCRHVGVLIHAQHRSRRGAAWRATTPRAWRSRCATTGRSASGPRGSAAARCARAADCGP